jgi:methoxymalonate biosynthesis protein
VKCLVWDLDNTLWQGTLLEDGRVHLADELRAVVRGLDARGILQSVASRNDHAVAWAELTRLGLAEYFVHPQIGWQPKSESVRRIADELRFAYDTIAFIDDLPAERAEVEYRLPMVRTYDATQAATLLTRAEFTPAVITEDSARRRLMYQAGLRREAARAEFTGPDEEFLRSLRLEMAIGRADEAQLARVAELTVRTSQMNATGVHYSEDDLAGLLADPAHEVLVVTMADRFGSHGAVGIVLLARYPAVWHLKLLATSCRVVSLGAGATLLRWLIDAAARAGVHLAADFRRTERNRIMEVAYRFAGFAETPCDCLALLPSPASSDAAVQVLHLVPAAAPLPDTVALTVPDLTPPCEVSQ